MTESDQRSIKEDKEMKELKITSCIEKEKVQKL